jgi:hypothetical protein
MAVEDACDLRAGDWIRIDGGGTEVDCEVSCTVHGPWSSVIGVMLADEYRRLEMLPDDSVMVVRYAKDCE